MVKLLLALQILLFGLAGFAQKKRIDFLVSYTVMSKDRELAGYKTRGGKIVIPAKFIYAADTLYDRAFVIGKGGWQGINRRGEVILIPFIYDNGPDYDSEGLFRFVENNKIGFVDLNWNKVVPAVFDFVEPFKDGLAIYTLGGHKVMDGEHWYWAGGYDGGYVNRWNQWFKKVNEPRAGLREAWTKGGKHVLLNKKGRVVKNFNR
ncbi:WG repeat-containing protein [Pedobacter sp. NJ-S-72]